MNTMTRRTSERRQYPRYPVGLTMDIHTRGQSSNKCRATIANMSIGGMLFKSNALLESGMSLYLKLQRGFEIRGEVRNVRLASSAGGLNRYGIRFHKISHPSDQRSMQ